MVTRDNAKNIIGLWIGPSLKSKGGVTSVIDTYNKMGFFLSGSIKFLPTMENGNFWIKLKFFLIALFSFIFHISRWQFIHVHMSSNSSFYRKSIFIVLSDLFKIPIIIHLHSSSFPGFYFGSGIFSKGFIRYIFRKASKILVLSGQMMDLMAEIGVADMSVIFPNPVVVSPYPKQERENNTVLFIGRLILEKGIYELLRSVVLVKEKVPDVMVWIAGTGEEEANFRHEITRMGLDSNFKFFGWIGGNVKSDLLLSATIMVSPSYGEGQSISILESMMVGLPVICTAVGGNEFLMGIPSAGVVVPVKEYVLLSQAIIDLLNDEKGRNDLALLGRARVETDFDYQIVERKLLDIYNSILIQDQKKQDKSYGALYK